MTTPVQTDTDTVTEEIYRALEPLRQALHERGRSYGRHSEEYTRLVLLAADVTVAAERLREAVTAGTAGLAETPIGPVEASESRYHYA